MSYGSHAPEGRRANIYALASGKGGVGKTFLSITLAQALAKLRRKSLLFDGDFGLANVDIQLGIMPERDLGNVVNNKVTLEQAIYHYKAGGFDIIAGRSGVANLATLSPMQLATLRNSLFKLSDVYDDVLIDLGAGVDRTMRLISAYAGHYLVVTNAEPTALTDAYAFIKLTRYEDPDADIRIIINSAESQRDGERTYNTLSKACFEFLKVKPVLAGIVRRDKRVPEAIRAQTPMFTHSPYSAVAKDVMAIAENLIRTPSQRAA